MPLLQHDTTLSTITLSTGDTDYMVWETFGATDMSVQLYWVGTGVVSTEVQLSNRFDTSAEATAGWAEATGLAVDAPAGSAASGGSWQRFEGAVAKRCRVKFVHNSGSTLNVSAWVVRANPRFP